MIKDAVSEKFAVQINKLQNRYRSYPTKLQLNKANSSDTEAPFLDLNLSITNGIVSSFVFVKFNHLFAIFACLCPSLCVFVNSNRLFAVFVRLCLSLRVFA